MVYLENAGYIVETLFCNFSFPGREALLPVYGSFATPGRSFIFSLMTAYRCKNLERACAALWKSDCDYRRVYLSRAMGIYGGSLRAGCTGVIRRMIAHQDEEKIYEPEQSRL